MTIDEIKRANAAAGRFFFQPSAMRFFRSRVCSEVHGGALHWFFVTSEQFASTDGYRAPRRYTVHAFDPRTGDVGRHSEFQAYATRRQALSAARRAAAAELAQVLHAGQGASDG